MTRKHRKQRQFSGVLYLTSNFMPFQAVSKTHAIKAVVAGRAKALNPKTLSIIDNINTKISALENIKLVMFDREIQTGPKKLKTKPLYETILDRDNYVCIYCGGTANTIDHVLPSSRGGKTIAKNCVAACKECNRKKADKTPEEAGMPFLFQPKTVNEILFDIFKNIIDSAQKDDSVTNP